MAKTRSNSIQYDLLKNALPQNSKNNNTIKVYKRCIKAFGVWAREQGYKCVTDIETAGSVKVLQRYEQYLESQTGSPSSIHTKLAPVCKGLGVSMSEVDKPKRGAEALKRGRVEDNNVQGKKEVLNPKFERLIAFQSAVGIRRAELSRLQGRDLVQDQEGNLCIRVIKGKGGKDQLQRILPDDIETVMQIMLPVKPDQYVFTRREMRNDIDLHSYRRALAQKAYDYYADKLTQNVGYREQLIQELQNRWLNSQDKRSGAAWQRYNLELHNTTTYKLRGANKQAAASHGRPVEYDRLAMMAVSVFHLSHWRLDVTAVNYLA